MALPETRYLVRMRISDVVRGVEAEVPVNASRHPSETLPFLALRLVAFAMEWTDTLAFGPGLCEPEAPTIVDRDPTGDVVTWIGCGAPATERLVRAVRKNPRAKVATYLSDAKKRARLVEEAAGHRELARVETTLIDAALVAALSRDDVRRSAWTVTIVEGHLYIDVDGRSIDGAWERRALAP